MKLFLATEAKNPANREKLSEFVGGFRGKTIAYIPTAANGEFYGAWKGGESIKAADSLGATLRIVELESLVYQDPLKQIEGADIIWMAGGMSGYLLYWIRRTKLDQVLPNWLQQGMIYIGSSAGSMIMSRRQQIASWFIDEEEPGADLIPGLGLIDFEIYPHFTDELLPKIKELYHGPKLYLLKNDEAITVIDERITVIGEERILVSNAGHRP